MRSIAIIGASVAGVTAAKALRAQGYEGALHLIGEEAALPYDRPPLSKGFLLGQQGEGELLLARAEEYLDLQIDLHLGTRAERVAGHFVMLAGGERIAFDKALLATGCRTRRLDVPGATLPGIHYLRTLQDARSLRAALSDAQTVAVVGGGFIGLEAAAAARQAGKDALVLEASDAPLGRVLPLEAARAIAALHQDHGVQIVVGAEVVAFAGDGRVEAVLLADGRSFPCDIAVVGVGVLPSDGLLGGSGRGIAVDRQLRTTMEGVYAAGDVARFPYRERSIRIEHWDVARAMAEHAARAMLGDAAPFEASPFFWSDQYDVTFQYFGHGDPADAIVIRGNPAAQNFIAFSLREGAISGAFTAGRPRDALALRRLVERAAVVDPQVLRSEDASLKRLGRGE